MTAALELRGVSRAFGAVQANRAVDLVVARGTVHAIVGENGAGKSTAMKIAYGEITADAGEIVLAGEPVARARHSPREAIRRGVGMVHQHFMLVGSMTVAENAVLGREPTRGPLVDLARAASELAALSARFGLGVEPGRRVDELSIGEQQRVEILKALWQGGDVLVLDEPTAVLTPGEVRGLFEVLRGLVAGGKTVVLITHKLDEVCAIADRITVMRGGAVVAELDGETASPQAIAHAMVGRPVLLEVARGPARTGDPQLTIRGLRVARASADRGRRSRRSEGRAADALALDGVDLEVRAGEIVGVAGVEGNGQRELVDAIVGLGPVTSGSVAIGGRDLAGCSVAERYAAGLAHIPEDRHHRGLILAMTVADNVVLGRHHELGGRLALDPAAVLARARAVIAAADVRPADPAAIAGDLSGGNQQKVVVARELGRPAARVLIAAQPTRGVDIGAIEQIHRDLVAARDRGWAVLLVSAELGELVALSDRLVVLYRGRIAAALDAAALAAEGARDRIGELMTGAGGAAAAAAAPGLADVPEARR